MSMTPVTLARNTSVVDNDTRSTTLDNNTMLNASHIIPVTVSTSSTLRLSSSIPKESDHSSTTDTKPQVDTEELNVTFESTIDVTIPAEEVLVNTEVSSELAHISEVSRPTIATTTLPVALSETVNEISSASVSPSETESVELPTPWYHIVSKASSNCTTEQSDLCDDFSEDSTVEPSSSSSSVLTSHPTTTEHVMLSTAESTTVTSTENELLIDVTTVPFVDNELSTQAEIEVSSPISYLQVFQNFSVKLL